MCGRFALFTPPARLAELFGAELDVGVEPSGRPRWNIAPTTDVLGLVSADRPSGAAGTRRVVNSYRWGLIPPWAGDARAGSRLFNARAETAASRPSFRGAFRDRRLAVLADGFFEWQKGPGGKRLPHYFHRIDGEPLAFAGLWESWRERGTGGGAGGKPADDAAGDVAGGGPAGGGAGPHVRSCAIITTTAGQDMDGIHPRMPVVLDRDTLDIWLDPAGADRQELQSLLRPARAGTLAHYPVDRRIGNVRNDDPGLIVPAGRS